MGPVSEGFGKRGRFPDPSNTKISGLGTSPHLSSETCLQEYALAPFQLTPLPNPFPHYGERDFPESYVNGYYEERAEMVRG